jgi:hypothetical protein
LHPRSLYVHGMQASLFPSPEALQPIPEAELLALLAQVIREARGGTLTREAEGYLAGVRAEVLAERLALVGVVVARHGG